MLAQNILTLTYTATGLSAGVTYQFRVQSRNSFGLSAMSTTLAVVAASVPDTPLNFSNVAGVTNASQIGLSWIQGVSNGGSPVLDY